MSDRSDSSPESDGGASHGRTADHPPARKRQRVRLSCLECRRRKLSCDRGFPCERCIKSGTPDRCSYESRTGEVISAAAGVPPQFAQLDPRRFSLADSVAGVNSGGFASRDPDLLLRQDHDRIRRLELEIAQLKSHLLRSGGTTATATAITTTTSAAANANSAFYDGSTVVGTNSPATQKDETTSHETDPNAPPRPEVQECIDATNASDEKVELRFFRGKGFRTRYFGPHNASMAFVELTGLCPFMRETADEWLHPVIVHDRKDRKRRQEERELAFEQSDPDLEALLPSKDETDALVAIYLDQFEQIHRIVHIPTFQQEYKEYWAPAAPHGKRYAAFTALLLALLAVTSTVRAHPSPKFVGMMSSARHSAERWIKAADDWLDRQSQKHRRLIHYQVACLLYLAKRVNTYKKKRFWTGAGALVQNGIAVGLHREPSHMANKITVYNQEMRRRIWATLQEFDMQASFDHGLPTLLSQLHYDTSAPRNLDDEDFSEDSTELPPSKPVAKYTYSSFQHLTRRSLPLRLELSRLLTGPTSEIDYDQVIRYTNDLTREIDALPSWDTDAEVEAEAEAEKEDSPSTPGKQQQKKRPLVAYTLLHVQLRQYMIPLHQPYLKRRRRAAGAGTGDSSSNKYQYSEVVYYNAARDIVLLHDRLLQGHGVRALNFLREDALTTAINLCGVTMLQPRGSTSMIMVSARHTLRLISKCLALKEDRLLRCGNNEPWGYSIMCAALGLLEAHLGVKTVEAARSSSAERFVALQHRLLANQVQPSEEGAAAAAVLVGVGVGEGEAGMPPPLSLPSSQQMLGVTLDQPKPVTTPFALASSMSSSALQPALPPPTTMDATSTNSTAVPWLAGSSNNSSGGNGGGGGGGCGGDATQLFNLDPSLELLGINLNELWGESWELGY